MAASMPMVVSSPLMLMMRSPGKSCCWGCSRFQCCTSPGSKLMTSQASGSSTTARRRPRGWKLLLTNLSCNSLPPRPAAAAAGLLQVEDGVVGLHAEFGEDGLHVELGERGHDLELSSPIVWAAKATALLPSNVLLLPPSACWPRGDPPFFTIGSGLTWMWTAKLMTCPSSSTSCSLEAWLWAQ
eukprot:CAMPEP_0115469488 /NCGR_PEP_ID=MMETSP0271-20121206/51505_1 /TAXON_ID=71861 /ORGANISM="Scrippsiella trochoidea, Strain CCMP3099" /LENGTH=183 /DNA_ID=CAMNT_0002896587 /DNA_START=481 /DNA_END=1032 /DNA_ORIENTATION=-